jgi:hypothetical protein
MAISAVSAVMALPERKVNGTPAHPGVVDPEGEGCVGFGAAAEVDPGFVDVGRDPPGPDRPDGVPGADRLAAHALGRRSGHRAQGLDAGPAEGVGVEAGRLFHQDQRHGFHEMVLHHVFQGAGGVVVGGPALEGQAFQPADVHVLGQLDAQDLVEVLRRCQVGAEGFLDRHRVGSA